MHTMIQFLAEDCPEVHNRYSLGYRMCFFPWFLLCRVCPVENSSYAYYAHAN